MRRLILLLPAALAACVTTGSNDGVVAIDAATGGQPLAGAACTVSTYGNTWNITTPASIAVGSPNGDLRVVCEKPGYRASEVVYRPGGSYSGSSVGIGAGGGGGHVGLGVGMSMPIGGFGGGGGYPARVTVDMNPQ